jgi:hypothetical protein
MCRAAVREFQVPGRFSSGCVVASCAGRLAAETVGAWINAASEVGLGTNRGASITKRERERARQQRQKDKADRRLQRKAEKQERPAHEPGVDPDIAGIVPGPQPRPLDE